MLSHLCLPVGAPEAEVPRGSHRLPGSAPSTRDTCLSSRHPRHLPFLDAALFLLLVPLQSFCSSLWLLGISFWRNLVELVSYLQLCRVTSVAKDGHKSVLFTVLEFPQLIRLELF